jgi:rubredoxin
MVTRLVSHQCSICSTDFTDDEGGMVGEIGILPVSLCPICFNGMLEMAEQCVPHASLECPECGTDIKIRVEIVDD